MDPFRDELAAAHGKIAQLEEEIRKLKGEHYPDSPPSPHPLQLFLAIGGLTIFLVVAVVASVLAFSRTAPAPTATASPAFSGVAIAPKPHLSAEVATSAAPNLYEPSPHAGDRKCDCQPGDPLCSCR